MVWTGVGMEGARQNQTKPKCINVHTEISSLQGVDGRACCCAVACVHRDVCAVFWWCDGVMVFVVEGPSVEEGPARMFVTRRRVSSDERSGARRAGCVQSRAGPAGAEFSRASA